MFQLLVLTEASKGSQHGTYALKSFRMSVRVTRVREKTNATRTPQATIKQDSDRGINRKDVVRKFGIRTSQAVATRFIIYRAMDVVCQEVTSFSAISLKPWETRQ